MMTGIIGIILLSISIICLNIISTKSTSELSKMDFIFIMMLIIGTILCAHFIDNSIKPIDVYRNKTELQIHYKTQGFDTLSKDTTVVWRKIK